MSASYAFEVSVSRSKIHDIASDITSRVPYSAIFIAGAGIGILLATIFLAITRHGAPVPQDVAAAAFVAPPPPVAAPVWAPLPVVTINVPPPETAPVPMAAPPPAKVHASRAVPRHVDVRRAPRMKCGVPALSTASTARDLLDSAL